MTEVTVTVRLFGALRDRGETISVKAPIGADTDAIKSLLAPFLKGAETIAAQSLLANDDEILGERWRLKEAAQLSLLPPVSGG